MRETDCGPRTLPGTLRVGNVFNGFVAETLVQYRLLSFGYNVFPCAGQGEYDLIADIDGIFVRVQVKSALPEKARSGRGSPRYNFFASRGLHKVAYAEGIVDIFAFVARDLERIVFKAAHEVDKTAVHIPPEIFTKEHEIETLKTSMDCLRRTLLQIS